MERRTVSRPTSYSCCRCCTDGRGPLCHSPLQGLEDAIAYRLARLAQPCRDCAEGDERCEDHSCDADLVTGYRQRVVALLRQKPNGGWPGLRPSA